LRKQLRQDNIHFYVRIGAVKQLIAINRIQNKSLCLHNICACTVYNYFVYIQYILGL